MLHKVKLQAKFGKMVNLMMLSIDWSFYLLFNYKFLYSKIMLA